MGSKGINVQAITQEHNVTIKFPDRESRQEAQVPPPPVKVPLSY